MNIAILTPGVFPVPAVKGGAVEMLTEYLLDYNEEKLHHDIILYGIDDKRISLNLKKKYKHTKFELLNLNSLHTRFKRFLYSIFSTKEKFYNYYLDYFAFQALKKIRNSNVEIVIIENRPQFMLMAARLTFVPLILHLHNDTLDKCTPRANEIVKVVAKILTVSNYIKQKVETIEGIEEKAKTVYNGIDLKHFLTLSHNLYKKNDFHFNKEDFIVGFIGRIDPIKGVKELLLAFEKLKDYPNIKLILAGGSNYGNSMITEYTQAISLIIGSLENRVYATGHLSYDEIPHILNLCDIAVIPSICEEALSLSSLEAMAVGLPLIITKSGGLPETVDDKCAIVIEKDNNLIENIASGILELYQNKEKREAMSIHSKERSKLFDKNNYSKNFFEELELIYKIQQRND